LDKKKQERANEYKDLAVELRKLLKVGGDSSLKSAMWYREKLEERRINLSVDLLQKLALFWSTNI